VPGSSTFSSTARHQVQGILDKAPYRTSPGHTPRPLAGVLHALGRALNAALGRPSRWFYHHVLLSIGHGFTSAFGGWWVLVVGILSVGLGVTQGLLLVKRRTRIATRGISNRSLSSVTEDPDEIDRWAADAEDAGDHQKAVRLRFRAGLLRLQRAGVIVNQQAQTDRQLSASLHSPTFDGLADRHERILYAGDRATAADAATARTDWPRVLVESRPDHTAAVGAGAP
jgi:hypothetical protein